MLTNPHHTSVISMFTNLKIANFGNVWQLSSKFLKKSFQTFPKLFKFKEQNFIENSY